MWQIANRALGMYSSQSYEWRNDFSSVDAISADFREKHCHDLLMCIKSCILSPNRQYFCQLLSKIHIPTQNHNIDPRSSEQYLVWGGQHPEGLLPADREQVHGHGHPQHGKNSGRGQVWGRLAHARYFITTDPNLYACKRMNFKSSGKP
jgi:hypothetical protein